MIVCRLCGKKLIDYMEGAFHAIEHFNWEEFSDNEAKKSEINKHGMFKLVKYILP